MAVEIVSEFANVAGPVVQFAKDAAFVVTGVTLIATAAFVGVLYLTESGKETRKALRKTLEEFKRGSRQASSAQATQVITTASRGP